MTTASNIANCSGTFGREICVSQIVASVIFSSMLSRITSVSYTHLVECYVLGRDITMKYVDRIIDRVLFYDDYKAIGIIDVDVYKRQRL